jgi:hypothetical protein
MSKRDPFSHRVASVPAVPNPEWLPSMLIIGKTRVEVVVPPQLVPTMQNVPAGLLQHDMSQGSSTPARITAVSRSKRPPAKSAKEKPREEVYVPPQLVHLSRELPGDSPEYESYNSIQGNQPREPLLSKFKETPSLALSSLGFPLRVQASPSVGSQTERAKWLSPGGIISKTNEPNLLQDSPKSRAALTPLITVPASSSQAPSTICSRKIIPRQWDSKNVVGKLRKLDVGRHSPVTETASMLSYPSSSGPPSLGYLPSPEAEETVPKREEKWLISSVVKEEMGGKREDSPTIGTPSTLSKHLPSVPRSSGSLSSPGNDETVPKREEKWLVSTAARKVTTSIMRCSPSSRAAPKLHNTSLPASPSLTQSTYL